MKKEIKEFMEQTSEISNKEVIIVAGCTAVLYGMAMGLNKKLFDSRIKNIVQSETIKTLERENANLKDKLESFIYRTR